MLAFARRALPAQSAAAASATVATGGSAEARLRAEAHDMTFVGLLCVALTVPSQSFVYYGGLRSLYARERLPRHHRAPTMVRTRNSSL